jgi:hypothetical protein
MSFLHQSPTQGNQSYTGEEKEKEYGKEEEIAH